MPHLHTPVPHRASHLVQILRGQPGYESLGDEDVEGWRAALRGAFLALDDFLFSTLTAAGRARRSSGRSTASSVAGFHPGRGGSSGSGQGWGFSIPSGTGSGEARAFTPANAAKRADRRLQLDMDVVDASVEGSADTYEAEASGVSGDVDDDRSGATAVVAVITPAFIFVANAGDSRAVLVRGGDAPPLPLSTDHKPGLPGEEARVEAAGGAVMMGRVNGELAVSRALGDFGYKDRRDLPPEKQKVSPEPQVTATRRTPAPSLAASLQAGELPTGDAALVLACDGVWDVMSNEDVSAFVTSRLMKGRRNLATLASSLVDACLGKDSKDNMTAMVVAFKPFLRCLDAAAALTAAAAPTTPGEAGSYPPTPPPYDFGDSSVEGDDPAFCVDGSAEFTISGLGREDEEDGRGLTPLADTPVPEGDSGDTSDPLAQTHRFSHRDGTLAAMVAAAQSVLDRPRSRGQRGAGKPTRLPGAVQHSHQARSRGWSGDWDVEDGTPRNLNGSMDDSALWPGETKSGAAPVLETPSTSAPFEGFHPAATVGRPQGVRTGGTGSPEKATRGWHAKYPERQIIPPSGSASLRGALAPLSSIGGQPMQVAVQGEAGGGISPVVGAAETPVDRPLSADMSDSSCGSEASGRVRVQSGGGSGEPPPQRKLPQAGVQDSLPAAAPTLHVQSWSTLSASEPLGAASVASSLPSAVPPTTSGVPISAGGSQGSSTSTAGAMYGRRGTPKLSIRNPADSHTAGGRGDRVQTRSAAGPDEQPVWGSPTGGPSAIDDDTVKRVLDKYGVTPRVHARRASLSMSTGGTPEKSKLNHSNHFTFAEEGQGGGGGLDSSALAGSLTRHASFSGGTVTPAVAQRRKRAEAEFESTRRSLAQRRNRSARSASEGSGGARSPLRGSRQGHRRQRSVSGGGSGELGSGPPSPLITPVPTPTHKARGQRKVKALDKPNTQDIPKPRVKPRVQPRVQPSAGPVHGRRAKPLLAGMPRASVTLSTAAASSFTSLTPAAGQGGGTHTAAALRSHEASSMAQLAPLHPMPTASGQGRAVQAPVRQVRHLPASKIAVGGGVNVLRVAPREQGVPRSATEGSASKAASLPVRSKGSSSAVPRQSLVLPDAAWAPKDRLPRGGPVRLVSRKKIVKGVTPGVSRGQQSGVKQGSAGPAAIHWSRR